MGIYSNGYIYGIRISNFNDEGLGNILYEKIYQEIMSHEQMREAYLFYLLLNDKKELFFEYYTECCSTLDLKKHYFYKWRPMSFKIFSEEFGI